MAATTPSKQVAGALGRRIAFAELADADLYVDAIYEGGTAGTFGDDPISLLIPCGNRGGFRVANRSGERRHALVVLYSTLADADWPDHLDLDLGRFTYYGDNKHPGHELHQTHRGGNRLLRLAFEATHATPSRRDDIPPFFVFTKGSLGRDVVFRGLAVPGAPDLSPTDDLVAIWRTTADQRFQNYRATFTLLDTGGVIHRRWISDLVSGKSESSHAPAAWREWIERGRYRPLRAPRTRLFRTIEDQRPQSRDDEAMLALIRRHFVDPHAFEACAAVIWAMYAPSSDYTLTAPTRDGGRDAYGYYKLGPEADPIRLDFALEAKCYAADNGVGVRELSRLISRLRHRQFGVLVTTSYLAPQAYEELRDDDHPVVVISARDIVDILKKQGIATPSETETWLQREFPIDAPAV
jgi:hypothetical protein